MLLATFDRKKFKIKKEDALTVDGEAKIVEEVIKAINSGKARVFLFRTMHTINDTGTLLKYMLADTDNDDEIEDENILHEQTDAMKDHSSLKDQPLQDLSGRILIF